MKNIKSFVKYYLFGFTIAAVLGGLIIIYSLVYDDLYSFIDFSLYMQVNSIMAVHCGLHLWIITLLDKPETIKNKYNKLFFKGFASYWLGVVFSFVILCILQSLSNFITILYSYYLTDDNLLVSSLIGGGVFGVGIFNKYNYVYE